MTKRATRWVLRLAVLAGAIAWAGGFAGLASAGLPSATTATPPTTATAPTAPVTQTVASTTGTVAASATSVVQQTVSTAPTATVAPAATATVQQVAAATASTATTVVSTTVATTSSIVDSTVDRAAPTLEAAATTVRHATESTAADTVRKTDTTTPTAARPSAPSSQPATSAAPTARQLPQSGVAGTIAPSSSSRQRPVSGTRVRTSGRVHAPSDTIPLSGVAPRSTVAPAAHAKISSDSKQRTPLPQPSPGFGLVSGASGEGGAAPLLFALLSFLLLLAIPTAVRWLRPAAALGLSPAYVALRDRPG